MQECEFLLLYTFFKIQTQQKLKENTKSTKSFRIPAPVTINNDNECKRVITPYNSRKRMPVQNPLIAHHNHTNAFGTKGTSAACQQSPFQLN